MRAEVMKVTPELARIFLQGNIANRKVSNLTVNLYAKDMMDGNWTLGGNGISISKSGILLDGQHRLLAVVRANVPVDMLVCTEVDDNVANFDTGRKRGLQDFYKLKLGRTDSLLTTTQGCAFVRSCYEVEKLAQLDFTKQVIISSYEEITEYALKNYDNIYEYYQLIPKGNKNLPKGLHRVPIYTIARQAAISEKNNFTFADYSHFCSVMTTGCVVEEYDAPFIGLRDKLILLSGGGAKINYEIRLRVCYALKKYLDKSTSRTNRLVEQDNFSIANFI